MQAADESLRAVLADVERQLVERAGQGCLSLSEDMILRRMSFPSSTYVVTRVAIGGGVALGPRERAVAELLAEGYQRKAIAKQLRMSVRTVDTHRDRIYSKLGVDSRAGLVWRIALLS
jgi:DNA-binding NarL/FixJ family response regulator